MIKKFRKKPVVIEAIQFTGENQEEIKEFVTVEITIPEKGSWLVIPTLEGDHTALVNDWIIKGIKGEFYPCKPDIFEETYEEVA